MFYVKLDLVLSLHDFSLIIFQKFGVTEKEVQNALLSGDPHDQLAIAYHLIVDNKRIEDETSKLDKDFYVASSPPPTGTPNSMTLDIPGLISRPGSSIHPKHRYPSGGSAASSERGGRSTPIKRAKWHLGEY